MIVKWHVCGSVGIHLVCWLVGWVMVDILTYFWAANRGMWRQTFWAFDWLISGTLVFLNVPAAPWGAYTCLKTSRSDLPLSPPPPCTLLITGKLVERENPLPRQISLSAFNTSLTSSHSLSSKQNSSSARFASPQTGPFHGILLPLEANISPIKVQVAVCVPMLPSN